MTRPTARIAPLFLAALLALPAVPAPVAAGPALADTLRFERPGSWGGRFGRIRDIGGGGGIGVGDGAPDRSLPQLHGWMHPEIGDAWAQGYFGQGTTITVVDDFGPGGRFSGDLGTGRQTQGHGDWVRQTASMIAPQAGMVAHDHASGRQSQGGGDRVRLAPGQLNTINLSYGMFAAAGTDPGLIRWQPQEASIITHARQGRAVVVKAAGNDSVAIGAANARGDVDHLNLALAGSPSTIFVGALERNGSPQAPAALASYSNRAGSDPTVQASFLVVGVPSDLTGLAGTSFAAPVVSGYAAVLGSKFTTATAPQISRQLLETARTDTILGYSRSVHGQGEASITRALAPRSIR